MSPSAGRPPMGRIVAFHQRPPDPEAWLDYYRNVHIPIVRRIPGLQNIRWGKVLRTSDGTPAPCWLISDVYFKDIAALETALRRGVRRHVEIHPARQRQDHVLRSARHGPAY